MRCAKLLLCLALLAGVGCARAEPVPASMLAPTPVSTTVDRFVRDVTADLGSFDVTQHPSTAEDRTVFVAKAFELAGAHWRVEEWKELHVVAAGGKPSFHLGLALVRFDTADAAARVYAKLPAPGAAFLAGTKILTRFVALQRGREILFVYSETHLQPVVEKFLNGLTPAGVFPGP